MWGHALSDVTGWSLARCEEPNGVSSKRQTVLVIGWQEGASADGCVQLAARAGFDCHLVAEFAEALRRLAQPETGPELILVDTDRLTPDELDMLGLIRALQPLAKIALCCSPLGVRKARTGLESGADWLWASGLVEQNLDRVLRRREYELPGPLPGAPAEDRFIGPRCESAEGSAVRVSTMAFGWEEGMLHLVQEVLEDAGCTVRLSHDPERVPDLLSWDPFDLGVFDCWDGSRDREQRIITECRRLAPSVRLLVLLSASRPEDVRGVERAGADACLIKPFQNRDLCAWAHLLGGSGSRPAGLLSAEEMAALLGPDALPAGDTGSPPDATD